jgi:hypothetical protein
MAWERKQLPIVIRQHPSEETDLPWGRFQRPFQEEGEDGEGLLLMTPECRGAQLKGVRSFGGVRDGITKGVLRPSQDSNVKRNIVEIWDIRMINMKRDRTFGISPEDLKAAEAV